MAKEIDYSNWREALNFSTPRVIASLDRTTIPTYPGLYVFQRTPGRLAVGNALYVGLAAKSSLRHRVSGYLTGRNRHTGGLFISNHLRSHSRTYIRWAVWDKSREYAGELISDLVPWYNSRREALWCDT